MNQFARSQTRHHSLPLSKAEALLSDVELYDLAGPQWRWFPALPRRH